MVNSGTVCCKRALCNKRYAYDLCVTWHDVLEPSVRFGVMFWLFDPFLHYWDYCMTRIQYFSSERVKTSRMLSILDKRERSHYITLSVKNTHHKSVLARRSLALSVTSRLANLTSLCSALSDARCSLALCRCVANLPSLWASVSVALRFLVRCRCRVRRLSKRSSAESAGWQSIVAHSLSENRKWAKLHARGEHVVHVGWAWNTRNDGKLRWVLHVRTVVYIARAPDVRLGGLAPACPINF